MQSIANMVNELNAGYEFYIFCSNTDLEGLPLNITSTSQWLPYNKHTKVWYAGRQNRSKQLINQLNIIKPGCLYMIGIYSWHFTIIPLFLGEAKVKILSVRGMLHAGALSQKSIKKKVFLQLMIWLGIKKKCGFHATDSLEAAYIEEQFGRNVQLYEAANFPRKIEPLNLPQKKENSLHLISIALISSMKNILLVLQALQNCTGKIQYDIYGPVKEKHYWEQCLSQIHQLPANISVLYHDGISPPCVPEKLATSQVFILPSKSENFGHAIYEALSAGLPVITSNYTPWNALEIEQAGINVETNVDSITNAIIHFAFMDEARFKKWSDGAIKFAAKNIDTVAIKTAYQQMFNF